jgi:hypothetical protein
MQKFIKYFPKPFLDDLVEGRCVPPTSLLAKRYHFGMTWGRPLPRRSKIMNIQVL